MKKGLFKRNSFLTIAALILFIGLSGPPPASATPLPDVNGSTESLTTDVTYTNEYIGNTADGTLNHSAGTNTVTNSLYLGYNTGIRGYYNLSGTGAIGAQLERIGWDGNGYFDQSGGTHDVDYLVLGMNAGSYGEYTLSAGTLTVNVNKLVGYSGAGVFNQSGGTNTVTNSLYLGYNTGSIGAYNLSGGTLDVIGIVNGAGNGFLNIDGGTLTVGGGTSGSIGVDFFSVGSAFGSTGSFTLNSGQSLSASDEYIGPSGTGVFNQTGGTNTVSYGLYLGANTGSSGTYNLSGGTLTAGSIKLTSYGTFNQTGGILDAAIFNQTGGTVTGTLQNQGTFNYTSGTFAGRLLNQGTVNLGTNFTAGDGLQNDTSVTVAAGETLTLNGAGLANYGTMQIDGTLTGDGTLSNYGYMAGSTGIQGTGGFVNYGVLSGDSFFDIANSGANANYGNIDVAASGQLRLTGGDMTNSGSLNLNGGIITGSAALNNSFGGTVSGRGTIATAFSNAGGVLLVESGTTNVVQNFSNSGLVQMNGLSANLAGGDITNTGSIEGYGNVGNNVSNSGTVEALGGTMTMSGTVTNNSGGLMTASAGTKLLVTSGLAENSGVININGGTFDNNNNTMINFGQISGYGTLRTGGLTNDGTMILTGGFTNVNGDVTNNATGFMEVANDPAIFTGFVTNAGTIKTTNTTVTWAGGFANSGAYLSDPSDNYFTDLTVSSSGYLTGGVGDNFYVSGDFISTSTQNTLWNTVDAYLEFQTGADALHDYWLTGLDMGADMLGYSDNFAWGTMALAAGNSLSLFDGNADAGGALYLQLIAGLDILSGTITNITGIDGLNIYYDALLFGNDYLGGLDYALTGGGMLMALNGGQAQVPEPSTLLLLAFGMIGLMAFHRRQVTIQA